MEPSLEDVLDALKEVADSEDINMMSSFGINATNALGVRMPAIRKIAKQLKTNHSLGLKLYQTGIHEAKILGPMLLDAKKISNAEFDLIVYGFDSWDVCDQACGGVLIKSSLATQKVFQYATDDREYVRRASFTLMTYHFVKSKKYDDSQIEFFLLLAEKYAFDDRNFVKKAISWALRQMGKSLNGKHRLLVLDVCYRIKEQNSRAAKWIASDVIRELDAKFA